MLYFCRHTTGDDVLCLSGTLTAPTLDEHSAHERASVCAGTTQVTLPGTHVTPCGSDMRWDAGKAFSPADALAAAARQFTMTDIRRLGDQLVEWLNTHSEQGGASVQNSLPAAGSPNTWSSGGGSAEPLFG